MSVWECQLCGHRYDPEKGDKASGTAPGTAFEQLHREWRCPQCGASRYDFEEVSALEEDDGDELEDDFPDDVFDSEDDLEAEDGNGEADDGEDDESYDDDEDGAFEEYDPDGEEPMEDMDDDAEDEDGFDPDDEAFDDPGEEDGSGGGEGRNGSGWSDEESDAEEADSGVGDEEGEAICEGDEEPAELDGLEKVEELEGTDGEGLLEEWEEDEQEECRRYVCTRCQWLFDPVADDEENGLVPNVSFEDLEDGWVCPSCGAEKEEFRPEDATLALPSSAGRMTPVSGGSAEPSDIPSRVRPLSGVVGSSRSVARFSLDDLVLVPAPLGGQQGVTSVNTLTEIASAGGRPFRLTIPVIISPEGPDGCTDLVTVAAARATARSGTACMSGAVTSSDARRASVSYIAEVRGGTSVPTPEELEGVAAVEWVLAPANPSGADPSSRPSSEEAFPFRKKEAVEAFVAKLRRVVSGPIGVRVPAGSIEMDLKWVVAAGLDFVVLEGSGAGLSAFPPRLMGHVCLPIWWAVQRARTYLDTHGQGNVALLASGDIRSPLDIVKLIALGANAVIVTLGNIRMMEGWRRFPPGGEGHPAVDVIPDDTAVQDATEALTGFLQRATEDIIGCCRFVGKADVHGLRPSELGCVSYDMARRLGWEK